MGLSLIPVTTVSAPLEALQASLAGRYRIERQLGRGGMATVYLAHDLRHDRPVALKVLHAELAASLGAERFQREIRTVARLQHPHILTVHDSGEIAAQGTAPAVLWFTMPFVEGETLRTRLLREGQLPTPDAIRIIREVADALGHAHGHGVVHRDLKPENILLAGDHALVADFGIARALAGGSERLTGTGLAIGTPGYMSPEQAAGSQDVDSRSDVYALGCVLYEMLAGELPFTGPTPMAVIARSMSESPRPLRQVRETVSPAVEHVVATALARAPADRFASAAQFAHALAPEVLTPPVPYAATAASPAAGRPGGPLFGWLLRRPLFAVLMLGMVLGSGVLFAWRGRQPAGNGAGGKLLAVLPFENVGPADEEYFVEGITDEVRGRLTGLPSLRVTARSSSSQYKGTTKSLRQIGQELGVSYLLTGTVRWDKSPGGAGRVKVSPELIDVFTGDAKWQQSFDASISDVFQVQADIAGRVARALDVALSEPARQQLAKRPTANIAAYDAYLQGRSYEQRARLNVEPQTMVIARQLYEKAVGEDSSFALAWASLAQVNLYQFSRDPTDTASRATAKAAAERAVALAPGSAEAHVALGDYASEVEHDNTKAMADYETALRLQPSNPEVLTTIAYTQWFRGRRDSALQNIQRASKLDPRSPQRTMALARGFAGLRRYAQADSAYDRAIALAPDQYHSYFEKGRNLLLWKGDVAGARRTMAEAEARIGRVEFVRKMCVACFDWAGPLGGDYERVLDQLTLDGFSPRDSVNYYTARAFREFMHDEIRPARVYWDSARAVSERLVRAEPEQAGAHDQLGLAYAGLGRAPDAAKAVEVAESLWRTQGDTAWLTQFIQVSRATNLLLLGDRMAAADTLLAFLADSTFPYASPAAVRVDPFWGKLKGIPRFDRLLSAK